MRSMTGFGSGESTNEQVQVQVDLKSYNNRYLDIFVYGLQGNQQFEPRIREFLRQRIARGKVEVSIRIRETNPDQGLKLDTTLAESGIRVLRELKQRTGLRGPITVQDLLKIEGIVRPERERNTEALWEHTELALGAAFEAYDAERQREGEASARAVADLLEKLEAGRGRIAAMADQIEQAIRTGIQQRFAEVLGSEIEENRILAEVASLVVKHSIHEELDRIATHLEAFGADLRSGQPAGRKLDFLSQELNREINTIGSKSFLVQVTQEVVQMKDALENIREILRNLE